LPLRGQKLLMVSQICYCNSDSGILRLTTELLLESVTPFQEQGIYNGRMTFHPIYN